MTTDARQVYRDDRTGEIVIDPVGIARAKVVEAFARWAYLQYKQPKRWVVPGELAASAAACRDALDAYEAAVRANLEPSR